MTTTAANPGYVRLITRVGRQARNAAFVLAVVLSSVAIATSSALAQNFTTLFSFDTTSGEAPAAPLVQAANGDLYGTTSDYGPSAGTVYKITAGGTLTTLFSFCLQNNCVNGASPFAGLLQVADGYLYGTTLSGGAWGYGTVFKITPNGTLTTLYNFCSQSGCADGQNPAAGLVEAADGDLYGTTTGSTFNGPNYYGTIFKITSRGTLTTLYTFCSYVSGGSCTDGFEPSGGLVQATDGDFYGTTVFGGANNAGTVFKMTPGGMLTTLHSFCSQSGCADGQQPAGGLIQAPNGDLYGTSLGGDFGMGMIFKITQSGTFTALYSFCSQPGCPSGAAPLGLVRANDGNFYGTTSRGGFTGSGAGTIFKFTPGGVFTSLYSFCSYNGCPDGNAPAAGLVQSTNGDFYGTTFGGGISSAGTIFVLSEGLPPFVETRPTYGRVGAHVQILGTNLTGTTSVTFNGTPAVFKVASRSGITTTVPTAATSGTVEVVTPSGTLSSNVVFRVNP